MSATIKSLLIMISSGLVFTLLLVNSQQQKMLPPDQDVSQGEIVAKQLEAQIARTVDTLGESLQNLSDNQYFQTAPVVEWSQWLKSQRQLFAAAGLAAIGVHAVSNNILYFEKPSLPGQMRGLKDAFDRLYKSRRQVKLLTVLNTIPAIVILNPIKSIDNQVIGSLVGVINLDQDKLKSFHHFSRIPVALVKGNRISVVSVDTSPTLEDHILLDVAWPDEINSSLWRLVLLIRPQNMFGGTLLYFLLGAGLTLLMTLLIWQQLRAARASFKVLDDTLSMQLPIAEQIKRLALLQNVTSDHGLANCSQAVRIRLEQQVQQKKSLSVESRKLQDSEKQLTAIRNQLENERDSAVAAPRLKSEFLSRMGDEITTPMKSVVSMLKLLSEYQLDDEPKQILNIAKRSTRTLVDNLNNILDFSKLDAKMLRLKPKQFSVRELIDELSSELAHFANEKELSLQASSDPEIPATVFADMFRIKQILRNLLSNAIRFTKQGEVSLYADLTAKGGFKLLRFTIKDTGIGIPHEAQKELFASMAQSTKLISSSFAGRLRLIVSRYLTELMGGEIGVISETGKGSQFWFTVRLDEDS